MSFFHSYGITTLILTKIQSQVKQPFRHRGTLGSSSLLSSGLLVAPSIEMRRTQRRQIPLTVRASLEFVFPFTMREA